MQKILKNENHLSYDEKIEIKDKVVRVIVTYEFDGQNLLDLLNPRVTKGSTRAIRDFAVENCTPVLNEIKTLP